MTRLTIFDPADLTYFATGRKKRRREFLRAVDANIRRRYRDNAADAFDSYFADDYKDFRHRLAMALETITIIGHEPDPDKIPEGYWELYNLFSECINILICSFQNIRMGYWLAGLVLLRQVIEIMSVCIVLWHDTDRNLGRFHEGKLKATKCVKNTKKIIPALVKIWGRLSNYHVHPSQHIIGTSFVKGESLAEWGRVIIGGHLHEEKTSEIEYAVINIVLVAFYLHATVELIFWQLINEPGFWQPLDKDKSPVLGTWDPTKENEDFLDSLQKRIEKGNNPFYGYEDRLSADDLEKYLKLTRSGVIRDLFDIEGLEKVTSKEPKFYFGTYLLANAYRSAGVNDKAINLYEKIVEKSDNIYDSYYFLGVVYSSIGNLEKATQAYERHLELHPDMHTAWNRLGLLYDNKGQYDLAIAAFKEAQKLETGYYNAIYNEGNALLHKGDYAEAIRIYEKALEIKSESSCYHNMGLTYLKQDQNDEAYRHFRKAVCLDPGYFPSWFNLSALCRMKNNPKKGYLCLLKCCHLRPDSLETLIMLGELCIELEKSEEAMRWAESIRDLDPGCKKADEIIKRVKEDLH